MEVLMIIRKTAPDVLFAASGTLQSRVGASATGIKMKMFFIQGGFSVFPATASLPFRTDAADRAIRELANIPWRQSPWCRLREMSGGIGMILSASCTPEACEVSVMH